MLPELWSLPTPWGDLPIKSYGFMMMLGFLVSIWFAMRRAMRVKADPDLILNVGFVCLFCGVIGARIFFVAHYWKTDFSWQPNRLLTAINITAGGLEYYGGVLAALAGTLIYLRFFARFRAVGDDLKGPPRRRPSIRLYLDILAPSIMLGLAFGRMGCFLNGCCWGGVCAHEENGRIVADLPWALTFPFGSGAHNRQWEDRQVAVPAELIFDDVANVHSPYLVYAESLATPDEEIDGLYQKVDDLYRRHAQADKDDPGGKQAQALAEQLRSLASEYKELKEEHFTVLANMQYPSREDPSRKTTKAELAQLAKHYRSLPVHPAQLYALINALLLSLLLGRLFHRRKCHGMVFALMLVIYPVTRVILELVRVDNPHDTIGLTISQALSVGIFVLAAVWLVLLYTRLPLRSERALAYAPIPVEPKKKRRG
jgi:phosphatidylglycerol:prolipoprotein diacylglycerol transferase